MATLALMRLSCTSSPPVLRLPPRPRTAIAIGIAVPLPPRPSIPLLLPHRPEIAGTALDIAIPISPLLRLHRRPSCCSCYRNPNDGEVSDAPPPPPAAATSAPRRRRGRPSTRSTRDTRDGHSDSLETATATWAPTTTVATVSPPTPALAPVPALAPSEVDKDTPHIYVVPLAMKAVMLLANFEFSILKDPLFWSETVCPMTIEESNKLIFPQVYNHLVKIVTAVDYAIREKKHQRHNISEDTWQQLLAFSRCVNENLEGYDPKGAWPILIDDFVEHLYRVNQANNCSSRETQPEMSNCYSGLVMTPGSKRKFLQDMLSENSTMSTCMTKSKRVKQIFSANNGGCWDSDETMNICDNPPADMGTHHLQTSACAVEDSLSKGFKGHLSIGPCFQFN